MSRVDELIKKLCPNGVEYKELGEIAKTLPGLKGKAKQDFVDGNSPYISYKNVHSNITADLSSLEYVKVDANENQNQLQDGDLLVTGSSESFDEVGYSAIVENLKGQTVFLNSFCFIVRFNQSQDSGMYVYPGFIKHLFRSGGLRAQIRKSANGVTRINLSKPAFMRIQIPVPPLEIQKEIARILDKFTQLEAELEAELEARRKQYAYYLEKLGEVLRTKFPTTSLGDVGDWAGGNTPSKGDPKYWENGEILWVSSKDMKSSHITATKFRVTERAISEGPARMIPKGAVLVVTRSSILERTLPVANLATEATINQDIKAIIPSGEFDHRYIYFAIKWSADEILRTIRKSGGSVTSLDTKKLKGFKIPAPPLEEQRRIVAILDKFDALVNGISTGLPAEIAARRKQYEYYRDKLLSFEPV